MDNLEGNAKLEWMYKAGQDSVNREEYLLGKKVDKQFDEATGNSVESEVLPFSIGRKGDTIDKQDQVDIVRKQIEDPLLLIKQKEIEARRKILENPVKLKKLHELLKKDKVSKDERSASSKKKRSASSSESDEKDLDELLMKKYKALQGSKQDQSGDESNFIDKKFKALKKELDKYAKKKKKSKHRKRSPSSSPDRKSPQSRNRYEERKHRSYNRSPRKSRSPRREARIDKNESRHKDRNPSPPAKESHSSRKRLSSTSDEESGQAKKRFGLVSASGEKISIKNKSEVKWYTKEQLKQKAPQRAEQKSEDRRKRPALSEAEKELKRREMMENANWREKDRSETVKKSRENAEKEASSHVKEYDTNFLNRHLKKAHEHVGSVESRIKSNLNNIQRSSRTMDTNFARR